MEMVATICPRKIQRCCDKAEINIRYFEKFGLKQKVFNWRRQDLVICTSYLGRAWEASTAPRSWCPRLQKVASARGCLLVYTCGISNHEPANSRTPNQPLIVKRKCLQYLHHALRGGPQTSEKQSLTPPTKNSPFRCNRKHPATKKSLLPRHDQINDRPRGERLQMSLPRPERATVRVKRAQVTQSSLRRSSARLRLKPMKLALLHQRGPPQKGRV